MFFSILVHLDRNQLRLKLAFSLLLGEFHEFRKPFQFLPSEETHYGSYFYFSADGEVQDHVQPPKLPPMGQELGVSQRSWHCEDSGFLCCSFGCLASTQPWNVVLTGSSRNPYWDALTNRLTLHLIFKGIHFVVKNKTKKKNCPKALQGDK